MEEFKIKRVYANSCKVYPEKCCREMLKCWGTHKYHTKQKAKIKKVWFEHGNHIGMEFLFQIDKNTFICTLAQLNHFLGGSQTFWDLLIKLRLFRLITLVHLILTFGLTSNIMSFQKKSAIQYLTKLLEKVPIFSF